LATTINKLKLGSRLVLGAYSATKHAPEPIIWLKGNRENEFISEYVLDVLEWDIKGRNDYNQSTIYNFMNSEDNYLFDEPNTGSYSNNAGFLCDFENYEIDSIVGGINLPSNEDIFGGKMNLFNRKGRRAEPSGNLRGKGFYISYDRYMQYWFKDFTMSNQSYSNVLGISRDGSYACRIGSSYRHGFRPKCKVKGDLVVEQDANGLYHILPYETSYKNPSKIEVFDESDIWSLFGIK